MTTTAALAPDRVTLEVPREPRFLGVLRIVAGGMSAHVGISYDALEDLQLAMDSVLAAARPVDAPLTVSFERGTLARDLTAHLGPFADPPLHALLHAPIGGPEAGLGLTRVLASLIDERTVTGGPDDFTVSLRKR